MLPAPPGEPYVSAGCRFYVAGNFDLDYVRSVGVGYGELTNDSTSIGGVPVTTAAQRMALSDYIFVRLDAPFSADPDSGALGLPLASLEYSGSANAAQLDPLVAARAAIAAWHGAPASQAQIIVIVDSGRPSVISEILSHGVSGLYLQWAGTSTGTYLSQDNADKVALDVAFGIVNGTGKLPAGLPLSDADAASQKEDLPGDGQHPTFVRGYGLTTQAF